MRQLSFFSALNAITFTTCTLALSTVSILFLIAAAFILGALSYRSYIKFLEATDQITISTKEIVSPIVTQSVKVINTAKSKASNIISSLQNVAHSVNSFLTPDRLTYSALGCVAFALFTMIYIKSGVLGLALTGILMAITGSLSTDRPKKRKVKPIIPACQPSQFRFNYYLFNC